MSENKHDATYHGPNHGWLTPEQIQALAQHGESPALAAPTDPVEGYHPGRPPWIPVAPPRKKFPAWAWAAIAVAAIIALCAGLTLTAGLGGDPARPPAVTGSSDSAAAPAAEDTRYKVGQAFRSGDFQYKIHGVKTGIARVGGEYSRHSAQGAFTRLDVEVTNTSREAQHFDADWYIKVRDAEGREFSADTSANIYGNEGGSEMWFTQVNPGNSARGFVYFDLPKGTAAREALVTPALFTFEADAVVTLTTSP